MLHLSQHVPAFVDGVKGRRAEAATVADLVAVPWVASYAADTEPVERVGTVTGWPNGVRTEVTVIHPAPEERRFYRWSKSDDCLMAEHNHGDHWAVVGRLSADDPHELDILPKWEPSEEGNRRTAAWNRGEIGPQRTYRCAEHGVDHADCCLSTARPRIVS